MNEWEHEGVLVRDFKVIDHIYLASGIDTVIGEHWADALRTLGKAGWQICGIEKEDNATRYWIKRQVSKP